MIPSRFVLKIIALISVANLCLVQGQQSSPREQLKQYVGDLQKNPSDDALREKIIKLALTIDPKPTPPPELQELLGRGGQAFEDAKRAASSGNTVAANADLALAADAFAKASLLVPWLPDYYLNVAEAANTLKDYQRALKNYQFYLELVPTGSDADAARQRVGALKYELEKYQAAAAEAERQRQAQAAAAAAAAAEQQYQAQLELERKQRYPLEGSWRVPNSDADMRLWHTDSGWRAVFVDGNGNPNPNGTPISVEVNGNHVVLSIAKGHRPLKSQGSRSRSNNVTSSPKPPKSERRILRLAWLATR